MNRKIALILVLMASLVITSGCVSNTGNSSYTMHFFINETGEPLEGNIFNNNNLLGYAGNGSFNTSPENLRPGFIALNGTYDNQPFEFVFEFPRESLNYSGMVFPVRKDTLKRFLYNTSGLDIAGLERDIFNRVNEERQKAGIRNLIWNDKIASIAKTYSKTLSIEGFNHKDIEGNDVGDRLKEGKIFYTVAAEDLSMIEGLNGTINISGSIVNGWMESPGHRSPIMDRDELFSDGGTGMYCEKKTCYAVMVFAGLEHNENIQLDPNYMAFIYLYDPSYPFDFDVPVTIDIESTDYINIYLVSGRDQYENFLHNGKYQSFLESEMTKKFNTKVVASKGHGVIIRSAGSKIASIHVHIRYS
ncbi:Cysteine-rich secretory protein family protein [uncultured archaeon]|nr:Cysteine-rich secretory protein family protein [uncultured archaeon]